MTKTEERVRELEQEGAALREQEAALRQELARRAASGEWDTKAERLTEEAAAVAQKREAVAEALQHLRAQAEEERREAEAARRVQREAIARAYDRRNRDVATQFAGLLILAEEVLAQWAALRAEAVREGDRYPQPLDLRPQERWRRGLKEMLRPLTTLLGDVSPLPHDRGREHAWRGEVLASLAEVLQGDLKALAEKAAQRERTEAKRLKVSDGDRASLARFLSESFRKVHLRNPLADR